MPACLGKKKPSHSVARYSVMTNDFCGSAKTVRGVDKIIKKHGGMRVSVFDHKTGKRCYLRNGNLFSRKDKRIYG